MRSSFIIAIVLIAAAIGLFFGVTEPQWQVVQELEARNARLDEALTRASDLQQVRDELISKFNVMDESDVDRLEKMLPDTIDSVRLILDVDTLARNNDILASGFVLQTVTESPSATPAAQSAQPSEQPYSSLSLSLAVQGSYENVLLFMRDIEQSLRLIDVVTLELSTGSIEGGGGTGRNQVQSYTMTMQTYWLR